MNSEPDSETDLVSSEQSTPSKVEVARASTTVKTLPEVIGTVESTEAVEAAAAVEAAGIGEQRKPVAATSAIGLGGAGRAEPWPSRYG
jgi:hypothetical protein